MAVNRVIKVFARVKKEEYIKNVEDYTVNYKLDEDGFDDLIICSPRRTGDGYKKFRFHKVFDRNTSQEDIFDVVAKPLINSVLEGFNGTIFAYGQTGSGKTYTITGSPKRYNDRGLIPRSLQYIFQQTETVLPKPAIHISYMEIYNEVGHDLLSSRQLDTATSLEELPRVIILEDKKGNAHIRNLSVLPVSTEEEAMKLLFLGDTNRTIAETPMNEYSSRSHCIFTIHVTNANVTSGNMRFSKLHIVDLAGSERVSKTLITGTALTEAKFINLSLHYLQQVIVALSERRRTHIPYRNSVITYILKDSLNGNCLSSMIANMAITKGNIEETISTCKFAYRVSLLKTEASINEITDPQQEIAILKMKIKYLEDQLQRASDLQGSHSLSAIDKEMCKKQMEVFLTNDSSSIELDKDFSKMKFCFDYIRSKIISQKKNYEVQLTENENIVSELQQLRDMLKKKDDEICLLKKIIDNIPEQPVNPNAANVNNSRDIFSKINNLDFKESIHKNSKWKDKEVDEAKVINQVNRVNTQTELDNCNVELLKQFMTTSQVSTDIDYYRNALESKLKMAKLCSEAINQCQTNIICIRTKLETCYTEEKHELVRELEEQQKIYKKMLGQLKEIQNETNHLRASLEQTEMKAMQKFNYWSRSITQDVNQDRECGCLSKTDHSECGKMVPYCTASDTLPQCSSSFPSPVLLSKVNKCTKGITHQGNIHLRRKMIRSNVIDCMDTCLNDTNKTFKPSSSRSLNSRCSCNPVSSFKCRPGSSQARIEVPKSPHTVDRRITQCVDEATITDGCTCYDSLTKQFVLSEQFEAEDAGEETHPYAVNTGKDRTSCSCRGIPARALEADAVIVDTRTGCCDEPLSIFKTNDDQHCEGTAPNSVQRVQSDKGRGPNKQEPVSHARYFKGSDTEDFKEFIKTVALTGEPDVDEGIVDFYRSKFS